MTTEQQPFSIGESGLVITVPEAEPVVGEYYRRFSVAGAAAVPPHVTVLFPFLRRERLDNATLAELATIFTSHDGFELELNRCERFPDGVLYLALANEQPVRALTAAVVARWPEAPPYGGRYEDSVPHLTVVHQQPTSVFDEVEPIITPRLPVRATVSSVNLVVYDGTAWQRRASFPLRQPVAAL
jgi:2'-5' RNA ligase